MYNMSSVRKRESEIDTNETSDLAPLGSIKQVLFSETENEQDTSSKI